MPDSLSILPQLATIERLRQTANDYWEAVWCLNKLINDEDVRGGMSREQKHEITEILRKAGF